MPIQAAANKLKAEIASYGCPPVFPENIIAEEPDEQTQIELSDAQPANVVTENVQELSVEQQMAAKSKGKRSKLAVKGLVGTSAKPVRQWNILKMMVPEEEIPQFADPLKWLEYFPPFGAVDLQVL